VNSQLPQKSTESIDGISVEFVRAGAGKPLLFLHSVDGIDPHARWFEGLAGEFELIAPWHPGFGPSERPREFRDIGDLAFFYLEFIRALGIHDAVLLGASFGGWLAAEIAIRSEAAFSHLVLVDALGIKVGGREDRDIADVFAVSQEELTRLAYHDPGRRMRDYSSMSDDERLAIARSRESYAFFGWRPYMHNPSLHRWLRRIRIPSLVVWGAQDGIVAPEYGEAFAAALGNAQFRAIDKAGHYPHVEQPNEFVEAVVRFVASANSQDMALGGEAPAV
jgi:pimeloyl-ACP methyl ester carboxylesterase